MRLTERPMLPRPSALQKTATPAARVFGIGSAAASGREMRRREFAPPRPLVTRIAQKINASRDPALVLKSFLDKHWRSFANANVAAHEGGHCVIAHALGRIVTRVTIIADDEFSGRFHFRADGTRLQDHLVILMAGPAAESKFRHGHANALLGAESDLREARDLIANHCADPDLINFAQERARQLVVNNWLKVERLARQLIEHRELSGANLRRLCE